MSDKDYEDEYEEDVENSAEDEYEYEDDAEASDEAIDGTEEAADGEMEHVEWGFETKKRRFSKEVVFGLVAVLCLVGVFGFVVHNQFSGDGEEVASVGDAKKPAPDGALGAEGDPKAATDPFVDDESGVVDLNAAEPGAASVAFNDQDEPSPDARLNDLLGGQTEPGFERQSGIGAADDPFRTSSDQFSGSEPTGTADSSINVASRDDVFGRPSQPALDPFGTEPTAASSLLDADPLLSQNDSSGLGTGQPASTLPEGDLLSGNPAGVASSTAEPFGSQPLDSAPAGTSGAMPLDNRPRGLFDDGPTTGTLPAETNLADGQGDAFNPGFSSESSLGQPSGLSEPLPGDPGLPSGPAGDTLLPSVGGESSLASDPFSQPSLDNSQPSLDSAPLGNEPLLGSSESSPVMLGNDLLPGDDSPGTLSDQPFGTEPAGDFQTPVVANQNDPFGSGGLSSPSAFDSSGSSTTTVGSGIGTVAPGGNSYTVQEADSFWSISKKVYGTSRYFEALQKYNRAKIDDPKKLKPGMVLDTPSTAILADYLDGGAVVSPQAIADGSRSRSGLPTAADSLPATIGTAQPASPAGLSGGILPIEPTGESETVQTVASSPSETTVGDSTKAGFFIGNQGYPMYRVANGDTLTAIAADHLGRASRWKQIFRMNQDALKSPDRLAPGVVLKLPGDASRVPLIDRTSSLR
jgi:nucleoid-associated protein YgaU